MGKTTDLATLIMLRRVRNRIDREYATPLNVEDLARGAHMSAGHLSREFKTTYNESPYSYLMTRRVERAMTLLRRGDLSVTEISLAVGYSSLGTFTTRFTELVGVSPGRYRRDSGGPHTNAEESLAFYRDVLGFEVKLDVGHGEMRWITVAPAGEPGPAIVLTPPAIDPGLTDEERAVINGLIAKGSYATIILATDELDALFERVEASNADVIQEPTAQDWGVRDFAFSDPAGNTVRVQQLP